MEEESMISIQWMLKDDKGKGICNFLPTLLGKADIIDGDKTIDVLLEVQLSFGDGTHSECEVKLSECDKADWAKLDRRCILNPQYLKANEYIGMIVRSEMEKVLSSEKKFHLNSLGIHRAEGEVVFCAGDRVITRFPDNESNLKFDIAELPFRMDIDPNIDSKGVFSGMQELISLSPKVGRVLVAYVISGIIRAAFKEAGFTPCAVLVVVGKSGFLKSHYVPHMTQLYNRTDEIKAVTRFNSTQRFVEDILYDYCECTAVIDDLHSAESKSIKKRNEETAEEIIRRISDDTGRGHKEGNELVQKGFRGNAVFIGEYMVGKESTIPRALVVELTERPDGAVLDKYQRKCPLVVSTFYYFFIRWYVCHFDDICNEIDNRLTELRKTKADSGIHGRLSDTKFYLQISYMFFLEFCRESGFIPEEDAVDEYSYFCSQLDTLISAQQARFESSNKERTVDYINLIRELYKHGKFCVAKKKEDFNPDKHGGVVCYDCLCLRGKYLDRKLKNINANLRLEDCIRELRAQNVLKVVENKNTVQISGTGGKRFYAIKLDRLV